MKVVIVGGVAGGASAAARLRRLDEKAEIVMLERGPYISFANCGLPYYIGGEIKKKSALTLQTPQSFKSRFNVDVRVNSEVTAIHTAEKTVTVRTAEGEYEESYDKLILSPGAAPIVPPLPGVDNERVFTLRNIPDTEKIRDAHMLTSNPDIYAVGDAVEITDFVTKQKGYIPLAGPANKQGRIAADNLCGIPSEYKQTQGSSVLKLFDMTIAMTGVNERTAKAAGLHYDRMYTYNQSHASYYPGGHGISMKVLYEKGTGRLLGAQLVGYDGVDKRCDVLAVAIRAGLTASDLTELELCYAPPFGSAKDPVNYAGYAIENVLTGKIKTFHWDEVASLPRDGSVTLLDVRTAAERANGCIDGFIGIPVDELREHIGELDPKKPIYVHCQSGLRSYIACRILAGYGFDCYNLTGGWRFYNLVVNEKKAADHPCYEPV